MVEHLAEMNRKIQLLRDLRAFEEVERRRARSYKKRYVDSRLSLGSGIDLAGSFPTGLRALYRIAAHPVFGDIKFFHQRNFHDQPPVDTFGNIARSGNFIQIGSVGEQELLLDMDSGAVAIYDFLYFRHGLETGFVVECSDVPEFVDMVALGPTYRSIHGPAETWRKPWWKKDPWYVYLTDIGFAAKA